MIDQKKGCAKCTEALVFLVAYIFIGAYALQWSWNTDASLFKWPVAEYRHALAAMLAFILIVLPFLCSFRHSHGGVCPGCGCKKDDIPSTSLKPAGENK